MGNDTSSLVNSKMAFNQFDIIVTGFNSLTSH